MPIVLAVIVESADVDRALMHLADIAHVEAALDADVLPGEAVAFQMLDALALDLLEQGVDAPVGCVIVEAHRRRRHVIVFDVGDDLTEGAKPGSKLGQHDGIDAHLARQRRDVSGSGAAGADQHEIARIIAALDRDAADAVHHVVVDDGEHAVGGLFGRHAQWVGDALKRCPGLVDAERQFAAEKTVGIEIAQHQIGVGRRRLDSALAIAGRSRIGAGRLRPDLQ